LLFPVFGLGWALLCSDRHWGLFNQLSVPGWLAFSATLIALDVVAYAQHFVMHRVPLLWQLHLTHHTDQNYDFSTALRFHPLETMFTTTVPMGAIVVLGAPPIAVLVSQLLSLVVSFVEHANVHLPASLDRVLRFVVVTPDMHRIHHSREPRETQANFSSVFPWWDRIFGTYVDRPRAGHEDMAFGVNGFEARKHLTLPWMLAQPFLDAQGRIGRVGRRDAPPAGRTLVARD
jgi:sterol desaturase/sphingolipid hydroxylase (fatty acid hydroxylase superfamily)